MPNYGTFTPIPAMNWSEKTGPSQFETALAGLAGAFAGQQQRAQQEQENQARMYAAVFPSLVAAGMVKPSGQGKGPLGQNWQYSQPELTPQEQYWAQRPGIETRDQDIRLLGSLAEMYPFSSPEQKAQIAQQYQTILQRLFPPEQETETPDLVTQIKSSPQTQDAVRRGFTVMMKGKQIEKFKGEDVATAEKEGWTIIASPEKKTPRVSSSRKPWLPPGAFSPRGTIENIQRAWSAGWPQVQERLGSLKALTGE